MQEDLERVRPLDRETLDVFAAKGLQMSRSTPQAGLANGVKVRRVMQVTRDLAMIPFDRLRILDLACGEGVYAIEAALRGAQVVALDARTERMNDGIRAAQRLQLANLRFEQRDVREVTVGTYGSFDVVFFLGILYHLDALDALAVLKNIHGMCNRFVVIDTHIALREEHSVTLGGRVYRGLRRQEHGKKDSQASKQQRLLSSIDNPQSFWFTRDALIELLRDTGFTSVFECHAPSEPFKPANRITLIAVKGSPVKLSSYAWVNDKSEGEIESFLVQNTGAGRRSARQRLRRFFGRLLHTPSR